MNKIKIMLTAVVVLSTVGGVLAFKATRDTNICIAATKPIGQVGAGTCGTGSPQNPFQMCTTELPRNITNVGTLVCTTTVDDLEGCDVACPVRTRTIVD